MRTRNGTKPRDANGVIYDNADDGPLRGWRLYRRAASAAPWISLKLIHAGPVQGAANYWLAWHATDKRLSNCRETARMPEALRHAVERVMEDWYPTLSDTDIAGYMIEVEAEDALR